MTAIKIHLNLNNQPGVNGLKSESSLVAALKNARIITGRDIATGKIDPTSTFGNQGSWNGAMGYITILDQIGKCYRPSAKALIKNKSSIIIALSYFTNLSSDEIDAIYALRNAFFHDFSLLNKDNTKNFHRFKVDNHPTNPVIILPTIKWDGNINNMNNNNETYANLKALGDLVENIYSQLLSLDNSGQLILDLPGGDQELLARYIFHHY